MSTKTEKVMKSRRKINRSAESSNSNTGKSEKIKVPKLFGLELLENTLKTGIEQEQNTEFKGESFQDMYLNNDPWNHYVSLLAVSENHAVLFCQPINLVGSPRPSAIEHTESMAWNDQHVKMPFSPRHIVKKNNVICQKWELIKKALQVSIKSSLELEQAIRKYHEIDQEFKRLHHFLNKALEEDERDYFFNTLLPQIIKLALQLPELIKAPFPLLAANKASSISLSQWQISSLMANAFLCTFPEDSKRKNFPNINFSTLFAWDKNGFNEDTDYMNNKLRCIVHYFYCVCNKTPVGVVTFQRKCIPEESLPKWDKLETTFTSTSLHITSRGSIENSKGMLTVDFADKYIGGLIFKQGCVQEEIRFLMCPELIISRLFTEVIHANEALSITGAERFNNVTGYGKSFRWIGSYEDETPFDDYGRRKSSVVAIDALPRRSAKQFAVTTINRELNKVYVGYYEKKNDKKLSAVATGKWGCGVFGGNLHLKSLIQIMACAAIGRGIVYYSFGDIAARDDIHDIYQFLCKHKVTIGQVWGYFCRYETEQHKKEKLYSFIKRVHVLNLGEIGTTSDSSKSTSDGRFDDSPPAKKMKFKKDNK